MISEPTYVMTIVDGGIIDTLIADKDLSRLIDATAVLVPRYLKLNGYRENLTSTPTTEDGFVQIHRTVCEESYSSSVLWTYKFDGEMSFEAARVFLEFAHQRE